VTPKHHLFSIRSHLSGAKRGTVPSEQLDRADPRFWAGRRYTRPQFLYSRHTTYCVREVNLCLSCDARQETSYANRQSKKSLNFIRLTDLRRKKSRKLFFRIRVFPQDAQHKMLCRSLHSHCTPNTPLVHRLLRTKLILASPSEVLNEGLSSFIEAPLTRNRARG
jgi:hypothetical protein